MEERGSVPCIATVHMCRCCVHYGHVVQGVPRPLAGQVGAAGHSQPLPDVRGGRNQADSALVGPANDSCSSGVGGPAATRGVTATGGPGVLARKGAWWCASVCGRGKGGRRAGYHSPACFPARPGYTGKQHMQAQEQAGGNVYVCLCVWTGQVGHKLGLGGNWQLAD